MKLQPRKTKTTLVRILMGLFSVGLIAAIWFGVTKFLQRPTDQSAATQEASPLVTPPTVTAVPAKEPLALTFLGDIMLDRSVWSKMQANGADYPFRRLGDLFAGADVVVANLEGPVTERGSHAVPGGSLLFKFEPITVAPLKDAGFHYLSLANNHTRNQGQTGLDDSRRLLAEQGLTVFGDPREVTRDDVAILKEGDWTLALIGWNLIEVTDTSEQAMMDLIADLDDEVDRVVVLPHWGNEYVGHTREQTRLAHVMIDAGADLIIGAHPHVVQGLEVYQERPIFYSLGNFIFDQYWSDPTEQGLAAHVTLSETGTRLELVPIDLTVSQPRAASQALAATILSRIAKDSDAALTEAIEAGLVTVESYGSGSSTP